MIKYLTRAGRSLSILLNVLTGGASNQTFSARNWGWRKAGKPNMVAIIDAILGRDHCCQSWVWWYTSRSINGGTNAKD